jgi:hypothetical protein
MSYTTDSQINFNEANREVLRITHDGRLVCGGGLSTEEATQETAKMLITAFEEQIQKMVDARVTAAASQIPARSESKSPCPATD